MLGKRFGRLPSMLVRVSQWRFFSTSLACRCQTSKPSSASPEDFSVDPAEMAKHLEHQAAWKTFESELVNHKQAGDMNAVLSTVARGLTLLEQLTPGESPMHCRVGLIMESAQAYLNQGNLAAARQASQQALDALADDVRADQVDPVKKAEIKEFLGFVLLRDRKFEEAEKEFQAVKTWIDVESKTLMPMVRVAALTLRRTTCTGLGLAMEGRATTTTDPSVDSRKILSIALDLLATSLDEHVEESDVIAVKMALEGCLRCFVGLGDKAQAVETCHKYITWCKKHGDDEGAKFGEARLLELQA